MSGVQLTVDSASGEPPYEQVRAQLAGLIGRGDLAEGDRLPTVRALAGDGVSVFVADASGTVGSEVMA